MKEHPIIFNSEMVKAILEGRKTMTRRVIKPQPEMKGTDWIWKGYLWLRGIKGVNEVILRNCPYGQVGDRLWCRERWRTTGLLDSLAPCELDTQISPIMFDENIPEYFDPGKWRPSIHMPRWASRIDLEITDIRVERLQEISWRDCQAEGIHGYTFARGCLSDNSPDARWAFIELWDSLNAKRGYPWESNSWVWVISFKRVNKENDDYETQT